MRNAIAKGQFKVLRTPSLARDTLSAEIGVELAALLREAQARNGVVIRPAPVNKLGLEERAEADMSAYATRLCDMHGLLKALADLNVLDEEFRLGLAQLSNSKIALGLNQQRLTRPTRFFSMALHSRISSTPIFCKHSFGHFRLSTSTRHF